MWANTRAKLVEVITASAPLVAEVFAYPTSAENEYPAVCIIGSENESDFGNGSPTNDNLISCVFTIRTLFTISDETNNAQQTAEARIDAVLDQLIDLLSNPDVLSPACDFVEPLSASWGYQDRGNGLVRMADIKLRCKKLK